MFNSKCLNLACTYMTVRVTLRFLRVCVCVCVCVHIDLSRFAFLCRSGVCPRRCLQWSPAWTEFVLLPLGAVDGCAAPEPAPISENRRPPRKSPACHEGVFHKILLIWEMNGWNAVLNVSGTPEHWRVNTSSIYGPFTICTANYV